MNYKLLALDMDGTLLNRKKIITEPVRQEIKKLLNRKIHLTIASGRFPASVWMHARYLDIKFPIIALNGAVILDPLTGQAIQDLPIPRHTAIPLAEYVEKLGVYIQFYASNVLIVKEINDMNKHWPLANVVIDPNLELNEYNYRNQLQHIKLRPVGSIYKFLDKNNLPALKATIINDNPAKIVQLHEELRKWPELSIARTGSRRLDINAEGVNKKTALEKICKKYEISQKEVVAVGDFDNDIEMIEWAGLGIAMGNGNDEVKKRAEFITVTNDDHGVAEVIKQHFNTSK